MNEIIEHPAGEYPHRKAPDGTIQYFWNGTWRTGYCDSGCLRKCPVVTFASTWAEPMQEDA